MINMARLELRVQLEEDQVPIRYSICSLVLVFICKFWEQYIFKVVIKTSLVNRISG